MIDANEQDKDRHAVCCAVLDEEIEILGVALTFFG
jgi:hypothetical protein